MSVPKLLVRACMAFQFAFISAASLAEPAAVWQERLTEAERTYDEDALVALVDELDRQELNPELELSLAKGYLALAELHRIEFENLDEGDRVGRRETGARVDEAADAGLAIVEGLTESSEQQRILADLLGTKIRSNFRAKRFRNRMEAAAARALELDAKNAYAYVSSAKPFLYASERRGGDTERAIELLETALDIHPKLEKGRLLLARAYEENNEPERAIAVLDAVLQQNPACKPAIYELERLQTAGDQ